jgi:tetratricopeptide (TPR) repeat protein
MQEQINRFKGNPLEFAMLFFRAKASASSGQLVKAREHINRAREMVLRLKFNENAATLKLVCAFWAASFGDCQQVRKEALAPLNTSRDWLTLATAATALSWCGEIEQPESLIDEMITRYPNHTLLNGFWIPTIKAAIETQRGEPALAIQLLQPAIQYDEVPFPAGFLAKYLRAQAYLQLGDGSKAAVEFQRILDRKGQEPLSTQYPLAHLGIARSAKLDGDIAKSRKAYQDFLALWKDADPDIPILIEAQKEYAELLKSNGRNNR